MYLKNIDNQSVKSILLGLWMAVMPLLFSGVTGWQIIEYEPVILQFTAGQWALVFMMATFTMALALTPTTLVAISIGYFLGLNGLAPLVLAYSAASLIGYFLAKPLSGSMMNTIQDYYPKTNRLVAKLNNTSPFWFVILCRLSPILPFGVMNVVLSYIATPLKPFLLGGITGMLPRTFTALMVGKLANDLINVVAHPGQNRFMQISFTLLVLVSGIGLTFYFKKVIKA